LPEKLSADNGYWSGDNLQALEQSGTDAYLATDKGEKTHKIPLASSDRKRVKADFNFHEADNTFTCPEGQVLTMKRESQDGSRVYQGAAKNKLPVSFQGSVQHTISKKLPRPLLRD
jgi:transposase